jgi:hypothetical protein
METWPLGGVLTPTISQLAYAAEPMEEIMRLLWICCQASLDSLYEYSITRGEECGNNNNTWASLTL